VTIKTVSRVSDELFETTVQGKLTWYVNVTFLDRDSGSIGKQDRDKALELQGLLLELNGQEADFTLEPKGETNHMGGEKFKIKGFGTPGGEPTYTAPSRGGGRTLPSGGQAGDTGSRNRSPEHDQFIQERMDRRTALMQAVEYARVYTDPGPAPWLGFADSFYEWLRTTSGSTSDLSPLPGVDPGSTSPAAEPAEGAGAAAGAASRGGEPALNRSSSPAGDDRGGQSEGEAGCPPHDLDLDVAPKAMRYPCRRCGFWVKPTMAAEEAEEAAK